MNIIEIFLGVIIYFKEHTSMSFNLKNDICRWTKWLALIC